MVVHDVHAQIQVADRIPHGARPDLPEGPVSIGRTGAQNTTGGIAVHNLAVGAIERSLPLAVPVVIRTGHDAPALGQIEVGTASRHDGVGRSAYALVSSTTAADVEVAETAANVLERALGPRHLRGDA